MVGWIMVLIVFLRTPLDNSWAGAFLGLLCIW
jgi:hypothetical protein